MRVEKIYDRTDLIDVTTRTVLHNMLFGVESAAGSSTGIGAQVQRPLALVVVGGMLLAPVLILIVLPVAIERLSQRERATAEGEAQTHAAE